MATYQQAREIFEKAYAILMEHGLASKAPYVKWHFIDAFTNPEVMKRASEWRFQGHLGFGGKFRYDSSEVMQVTCYPEDLNPKTEQVIDKINALLKELPNPGPPPYSNKERVPGGGGQCAPSLALGTSTSH